jgi:hypothetical protein
MSFIRSAVLVCIAFGTVALAALPPLGSAPFTEHHTLFYTLNASSGAYNYSFTNITNARKAVELNRNPSVQGWDYVKVATRPEWFDGNATESYYAAGYAEGFLTADSIYSMYYNAISMYVPQLSPCFYAWLDDHWEHMHALADADTGDFGAQLRRQLRLVRGIADGYNAAIPTLKSNFTPAATALNYTDIFLISFQAEIGRALAACNGTAPLSKRATTPPGHCSALVKVTADDVILAHTTWAGYTMLVRMFKTYDLGGDANAVVTMSSYPGSLSSIDDWYMTSHGIAATETTISPTSNADDSFVTPRSVSEFMRVMIANFLAQNPKEWADLFATHNSGTYNNEYMVVHMRAVEEHGVNPLPNGSFYVVEQMPGSVIAHDMTDYLQANKFWSSFNIPHFNESYVFLGYEAMYEQYGDYFSRTKYARARIFHDKQATVVDEASMLALIRYNNYTEDEYGIIPWCKQAGGNPGPQSFDCPADALRSGVLAIAARGDLAPQAFRINVYPYMIGDVARGLWGAIDAKITSGRLMAGGKQQGIAVCGPSPGANLGHFSWSEFAAANVNNSAMVATTQRRQMPDRFAFEPVLFCEGKHC